MRPRQDLLEIFSTFLQFEADRSSGWATDAKLRRSMQRCLTELSSQNHQSVSRKSSDVAGENFWVIYWYKAWQTRTTELEQGHLSSYLQEVCYWAAQKTVLSFASTQYTLPDCFQVAIARVDKVLKGFNPNQGSNLKNYAGIAFNSVIREFLRQRQIVDICSDWSLLRKVSQKRLITALQGAMFSEEAIERYVLAWNCLKIAYVPQQASSTRQLPKPSDTAWQAIAKLYNSERKSQIRSNSSDCTPEILERWMQDCVKAVRAYLYPAVTSINAPKPGQDAGEIGDTLLSTEDSLLTEMIVQEEVSDRQNQQAQLSQVLAVALAKLDPQVQQLLELYYAKQLTQQEIAKQLGIPQYTISRRFTKVRETLLKALTQWCQETLHIAPTLDILKSTSSLLEEWLTNHYGKDAG